MWFMLNITIYISATLITEKNTKTTEKNRIDPDKDFHLTVNSVHPYYIGYDVGIASSALV